MTTTIPIHITWSSNRKTGHIPVSTTGEQSCPSTCPHKDKSCYARFSYLGIHWRKVTNGARDMGWDSLFSFVKSLPNEQVWRYAQAGDLPGHDKKIDEPLFNQLVQANLGKRGYTYTHKPLTPKNLRLINHANQHGFTINVSSDDPVHAVNLYKRFQCLGYKIPVVVTVPSNWEPHMGSIIRICPAQLTDVTCDKCQWCAMPDRKFIVAFQAHGTRAKDIV